MDSRKRMAQTFVEKELKRTDENRDESLFFTTSGAITDYGKAKSEFILSRIGPLVDDILNNNEKDVNLDLSYNIPFWVQHILKKPYVILRYDALREEKIVEETSPDNVIPFTNIYPLDKTVSLFPDIVMWRWYVANIETIFAQLEDMKEMMFQGFTGNTLVISNHATWANLPFLAFCFHYVYGIPKENIYTMV